MKAKRRKQILTAVFLIVCLCLFTGCIPNGYTGKEKSDFLREAEKAASDYLQSVYEGAVIKEIQAEITVENSEYVLTEFARGQFRWQEQLYTFVVNAETGEVYTSVGLHEIKEGLQAALIHNLGIDSRESAVVNYMIYYRQGGRVERSTFCNVFPDGARAEDLLAEILTDAEAYSFSMDVQYKGGDIPWDIVEEEAPFPTLEAVNIYHIAGEYELTEVGFSNLPILSEEILQCSYTKDSVKYTRNQVMKRDGLLAVYNAYEWTREQDTVTEKSIDEKDIDLTMTEDYIALDCTKEHFVIYLMTADERIAQEYLYFFAMNGEDIERGGWYFCGNMYVYARYPDIEVPDTFTNGYRRRNMIFSRKAYDRAQKKS